MGGELVEWASLNWLALVLIVKYMYLYIMFWQFRNCVCSSDYIVRPHPVCEFVRNKFLFSNLPPFAKGATEIPPCTDCVHCHCHCTVHVYTHQPLKILAWVSTLQSLTQHRNKIKLINRKNRNRKWINGKWNKKGN